MKKAVIFGTFDGVHEGHRHLIREALAHCDEIIVIVARDEHVLELKGHIPFKNLDDRMEMISLETGVSVVVPSDEVLGSYLLLSEHKPNVIIFGYDQDALMEDVNAWMQDNNIHIECVQASAYMPEIYKSSFLNEEQVTDEEELLQETI
ncbi:MAG: adenylyltransferase/cytidyltransferase family protein [Patescibacteria group bacterium]